MTWPSVDAPATAPADHGEVRTQAYYAGGGDYFRSGYYSIGTWPQTTTALTLSLNIAVLCPFIVPVRRSFDRIGANVSTAATAASGGVLRAGIYRHDSGVPGALLVDGGTLSSETLGGKEWTVAESLDPGIYWLAVVAQVAACGVTALSSNSLPPFVSLTTTPVAAASLTAFRRSSVSGALPNPFAANSNSGAVPLLSLRAT